MSQDRAQRGSLHATNACPAIMWGVRSVGVTAAAGELQRLGLIVYRRGELTVLDREALHARACSCYDSNRRVYEQLVH